MRTDKQFLKRQFYGNPHGETWLKGFGLILRGAEKYGVRMPFTPAGPFEVVWNITRKCNLKCKHCYENAGTKHPQELSTQQAKHVIRKFSRLAGVGLPALSFSGGEPLARTDFIELAAYAKKHIGFISVATNGTLITKDKAKQMKDIGVDYVEISVDGSTAEVHDGFRGIPGAFNHTIQGVKNCVEEGIDTCIATVLHRDNVAQLDGLLKLVDDLGVRFMHFNYIPTGRAKGYVDLDLTPKERLRVLEVLGEEIVGLYREAKQEEILSGKSDVRVDRFFSTCPQYASVTREISERSGESFLVEAHYGAMKGVESVANFLGGCGAGRLYCCLEPNGDVKPCVFFPSNSETVLGNVLKDDFEEIWDHNTFLWQLRTRELLRDHVVDGVRVGCAGCRDKYICGGCRARSYGYFSGEADKADIGCIHNQLLWEKVVGMNR